MINQWIQCGSSKFWKLRCCGNGKDGDGYGNIMPVGVNFIKGDFMEKSVFFKLEIPNI